MADNQVATTAIKPALVSGGKISAIIPQDFDSAYRLANVVVKAGMAPKSLDTVEKATVAILHGLEVGLTPMAALQSIAVINGMPAIWGDGMLGLIRASGLLEDIVEEVEVDEQGEPTIAVCKVKRRGEATWAISSFTRPEAQRAGLWGKAGPWQGYKARMLKMRARSWALRDKFADVLRGLHMAEEAADMVDITPRSPPPPEPRRNPITDVPSGAATTEGAAAAAPHTPAPRMEPPPSDPPERDWRVPDDVIGQANILKALDVLLEETENDLEQDAFEAANAERIAKITGLPKSQLIARLNERRRLRRVPDDET